MGIPYLYGSWLRSKKYDSVLKGYIPNIISSLSIDANALVYMALQIVFGIDDFDDPNRQAFVATMPPEVIENEITLTTMAIIESLIHKINPTHHLIIAFDGPAPMSKIQQQKERRYKSAISHKTAPVFDTNAITPGTKFMRVLDSMIQESLTIWYSDYKIGRIIYSSHMVPGEGEHKIMDHYRSGLLEADGVHVIYGMDADLIMLSMLSPLKNIILARDSIEVSVRNSSGDIVRSKTTTRNAKNNIYIDELRMAIANEMGSPTAIRDFNVIVAMVGNDFLPHIEATRVVSTSIDRMIEVYKLVNESLTNSEGIVWSSMLKFLAGVSAIEENLLNSFYQSMKGKSRMLEAGKKPDGTIDFATFRDAWYTNEFYKDDYIDPRKISDMAYQYLMGIAWTLKYYTEGQDSVTWMWYYPYHHAPTIYDMAYFMSQVNPSYFKVDRIQGEFRLTAAHHLLAVIPRLSINLLPEMLKPFYAEDSPLYDIMPDSFPIETDGNWKEWQSTPILPKADYDRIVKALDDVYMEGWDHEEEIHVTMMKHDVDFMIQQRYKIDKVAIDKANRERWILKKQKQAEYAERQFSNSGKQSSDCKPKRSKTKKPSAWGNARLLD